VQAIQNFIESELQPTSDGFSSELQPFFQQAYQVFDLGSLVDTNHVEIDAVVLFQISG